MKKNKKMTRILAAATAAVMLAALAAGCSKDEDSPFEPPEFVYVSQSVPLPEGTGDIYNLVYTDGRIFFVGNEYKQDEKAYYLYTYLSKIYSMNIDGTGYMELPEYTPPVSFGENTSGDMSISSISVDSDGNLWVIERWSLYRYNLPDGFDPENDYPWEYQEQLGNGTAIRKLSPTGKELLSVDLSNFFEGKEYYYIGSFGIDAAGNIYFSSDDWERGGVVLYVLDSDGNKQFEIISENWFERFLMLADGSLAIATDMPNDEGYYSRVLLKVDYDKKDFGDVIELPQVGWNIFPGGNEYDLLISDYNNGLFGFAIGGEEAVKLLDWIDSDIINNGIGNITMLPDGRIICTNYIWDRYTYESNYELLILTKTPYSELPERKIITLATFYMGNNRDAVVKFNKSNPEYRIQVTDYSQFNTQDDYMAGLNRLSTEIISGKIPDIIDVSNLPYKEYVARGLLENLYPYIEADPDFSIDSLMSGALRAAEIDGGLYQIFASFYVHTLAGHPDIVGAGNGWTIEEFTAVLDGRPEADMPLGQWLTKMNFLQAAIAFGIDDYINWGTGKVSFDTPHFIQLLEFANKFPDEIDWDTVDWASVYVPEEEAIATGRQIMVQMSISEFYNYMYYKNMFGGELVFKGFPNSERRGNSLTVAEGLAMTASSKNKDGAWEFMRMILDKDWQLGYTWSFPTNKAAFDRRVSDAMEQEYDFSWMRQSRVVSASGGGRVITESNPNPFDQDAERDIVRLTQEDVDRILELIDSANGTSGWNVDQTIWELISDGITDYFSGAVSAQDAARVIQSRVQILVSERS